MGLKERIEEAMGDMPNGKFAKALNVSAATVTFWLSGETQSLKAENANRMEAVTGYRAAWIVTGRGPKKVDDTAAEPEVPLSVEVKRKVLGLKDHDLRRLENIVRVYVDLPVLTDASGEEDATDEQEAQDAEIARGVIGRTTGKRTTVGKAKLKHSG